MNARPPAILVVDNQENILAMFADYFTDLGYPVHTAPDGHVALTMLRTQSERFGLILLDLMMPRLDGYQFREEQLADPNIAQIPVVVMTTSRYIQAKGLPRAMRSDHVLPKPPDFDKLLVLVRRYCGPPT